MLTQKEIVPYLLRRELISPASIVEGDLVVRDVSRRNRNYKVISERGPSYLVKQGIGEEGRATVAHEATVYQLLHARAGREGLNRYVPRCHGYDAEEHVLVLELLRDAESLREYHARRGHFSVRAAAAIGEGLGAFHGLTKTEAQREGSPSPFPDRRPWALSLHRPDLGIFRSTSSGNIHLIKIIQQFPEFCGILDGLNRGWRAESLIHFDVKADNFVLFAPPDSRRRSRLKIIDWELAGRGDPCWDAGSVFSDYLSFWLFSMPVTGETPPNGSWSSPAIR